MFYVFFPISYMGFLHRHHVNSDGKEANAKTRYCLMWNTPAWEGRTQTAACGMFESHRWLPTLNELWQFQGMFQVNLNLKLILKWSPASERFWLRGQAGRGPFKSQIWPRLVWSTHQALTWCHHNPVRGFPHAIRTHQAQHWGPWWQDGSKDLCCCWCRSGRSAS